MQMQLEATGGGEEAHFGIVSTIRSLRQMQILPQHQH